MNVCVCQGLRSGAIRTFVEFLNLQNTLIFTFENVLELFYSLIKNSQQDLQNNYFSLFLASWNAMSFVPHKT